MQLSWLAWSPSGKHVAVLWELMHNGMTNKVEQVVFMYNSDNGAETCNLNVWAQIRVDEAELEPDAHVQCIWSPTGPQLLVACWHSHHKMMIIKVDGLLTTVEHLEGQWVDSELFQAGWSPCGLYSFEEHLRTVIDEDDDEAHGAIWDAATSKRCFSWQHVNNASRDIIWAPRGCKFFMPVAKCLVDLLAAGLRDRVVEHPWNGPELPSEIDTSCFGFSPCGQLLIEAWQKPAPYPTTQGLTNSVWWQQHHDVAWQQQLTQLCMHYDACGYLHNVLVCQCPRCLASTTLAALTSMHLTMKMAECASWDGYCHALLHTWASEGLLQQAMVNSCAV